jgi:hypothetical protein
LQFTTAWTFWLWHSQTLAQARRHSCASFYRVNGYSQNIKIITIKMGAKNIMDMNSLARITPTLAHQLATPAHPRA